jgi:hypothetical protein
MQAEFECKQNLNASRILNANKIECKQNFFFPKSTALPKVRIHSFIQIDHVFKNVRQNHVDIQTAKHFFKCGKTLLAKQNNAHKLVCRIILNLESNPQ